MFSDWRNDVIFRENKQKWITYITIYSSSGYDNQAYDVIQLEKGECDSSSDDEHYGNTYEKINAKNRFTGNPANRLFGNASKK